MSPRAITTIALISLVACGSGAEPRAAGPTTTGVPGGWLDAEQRGRADQLISAFENSTTELQYDYAEDLDDGRGITAGRAGFTTATCDALEVIDVYTEAAGDNDLAGFRQELDRLCDEGSDDTSGLPAGEYVEAWQAAAADAAFRAAQDSVVDREYYEPAMAVADAIDLGSALARAELYDTAIQHGAGDDPDGLQAIVDRTVAAVGEPADVGDEAWLDAFLDERIATLEDPSDQATAEDWRASTDRVECFRRIAATGNLDLHGPIEFTVYGDAFTID